MINTRQAVPDQVQAIWDRLLNEENVMGMRNRRPANARYAIFRAKELLPIEFNNLRSAFDRSPINFEENEEDQYQHLSYLANISYYVVFRIIEHSEYSADAVLN